MTVYLVGAGPGDPGLLTRRGAELLRAADVVVYDRLAPHALLDLARTDAELIDVGKAPGDVAMTQDQINALLVARGTAGLEVVRLKGGDPFVFGRGGEEAEACITAGVPFEVVPGITSAIAAAAYAGIPVTHRRVSTSFTVVTGHEDPTKGTSDTRWDALAQAGGTLVILMGAGRVEEIAKALVAGGRDESTPVAAVRYGTRPDQHTVRATLGTIADIGVQAPSAIIVGDVAALDFGWFERRPLFGRTVVITRRASRRVNCALASRRSAPQSWKCRRFDSCRSTSRARPLRVRVDRLHFGEWCRRLLRSRLGPRRSRRTCPRTRPHRRDRTGNGWRAGAPRPAAPTWCPSGSSQSRCSMRSPTAPLRTGRPGC